MKARFTNQQQAVNWQSLGNGLVDVTICLNEEEATQLLIIQGGSREKAYWQYDFNQFREKEANLSKETIEANPEEYLTYTPKEETLEERVKALEETIKTLTETTT